MTATAGRVSIARLRARLTEKGMAEREVSQAARLGLSFVNDILTGKSKNPARKRVEAIAEVLDCDVEYLFGEQDEVRRKPGAIVEFPSARIISEGSLLPLLTPGWPDKDGFFPTPNAAENILNFGEVVEGAFAVVVPDNANAPRYRAGEIVFAHPRRFPTVGSFVVLRLNDERMTIREIVSIDAEKVEVRALADEKSSTIAREDIKLLHRITATREA